MQYRHIDIDVNQASIILHFLSSAMNVVREIEHLSLQVYHDND